MNEKTNLVRIKLHASMGGHRPNGSPFAHQTGTSVDWDAKEAKRLVEAGYASYETVAK